MNLASKNHGKINGFCIKSDRNHDILKVSRGFAILIGFYKDLKVWEASRRAPGGSPETISERFGCIENVLGGL